MSWTWLQDKGHGYDVEGFHFDGYSGSPECRNNPAFQEVHNAGPIPRGIFIMGTSTDAHGPISIPLHPHPDNEMFGRSGFYIHGDEIKHPGCASHGCIIAGRTARLEMCASITAGDNELTVKLSTE